MNHKSMQNSQHIFSIHISVVLAISKYLRILKFLRKTIFAVITTRLNFDTSKPLVTISYDMEFY